jgi:para-aminobenzoate synthetase / 4-amino-4-deoxychorismate lyase
MNECAAISSSTSQKLVRFLFDNSADPAGGSAILLENPTQIIRADSLEQVLGAIERLQQAIDGGLYAAGFFSYELGYALEKSLQSLMPENRQVPLLWFALFDEATELKGSTLTSFLDEESGKLEVGSLENIRQSLEKSDYLARFAQVKDLIAAGDIYQVNLTFKLLFDFEGSPLSLYKSLRERQPVPYGAFLESNQFSILSLSPELFFELKNGVMTTRPMKGTARRGLTVEQDRQLSHQLHMDAKNRAENLMIVDLMRNDFARICDVGTVEVSDLYHVDAYPTLHQMTSGVLGRVGGNMRLEELIRALIPAGSITGAPKIRAQEVISELEDSPRGLYCGAMGILSRDKQSGHLSARFNVAIRTLTLFPDGRGEAGIGSGIVQDSQGADEYEECLLKAKFLSTPDFKLIETMRLDPEGSFYLLENHLARLMRSSAELGFLCPVDTIRKDLSELASSLDKNCYLVRLLLSIGGQFTLTSTLIDCPDPDKIISFCISKTRVDSNDSLLVHKTTRRELFDGQWAKFNKKLGTQEVLFLNERGELTEGSRSNLFIEREGKLLTPPLNCGLLPGTLREQLIEEGRVVETVLKPEDLQGAKIYFGNSVRGLQPARQVEK